MSDEKSNRMDTDMSSSDSRNFTPVPPKKRGRPLGSKTFKVKEVKKKPECETRPLEYPNRIVVWGTEHQCPRFKRKGLAILYDPSRGKHYILMPVTDDSGSIKWRYRWVHNARDKYRYEQIDLEPGMIPETIKKLREIADALEQGLEWIGGAQGAKKVEQEVIIEVRKNLADDRVSEKLRKLGGVL